MSRYWTWACPRCDYIFASDVGIENGPPCVCGAIMVPARDIRRQPPDTTPCRGARCADCPHDECDELANMRRERDDLLAQRNQLRDALHSALETMDRAEAERDELRRCVTGKVGIEEYLALKYDHAKACAEREALRRHRDELKRLYEAHRAVLDDVRRALRSEDDG